MQNRQPCGAPWPTDEEAIMVAWESCSLGQHLKHAKLTALYIINRLQKAIDNDWDISEAIDYSMLHNGQTQNPDPKGCLSAQRRYSYGNYAS